MLQQMVEQNVYYIQIIISKYRCAPSRQKARTKYLLTTKLFCGYCENMMVGVAGSIVNYFVGGDLKTGAYSSAFSSASWEDTLRHSASGAGVSSDV